MAELEGFLCPLCKQDCRSVTELEAHYRDAHEESAASKFKRDFVSFFENAFNISPKVRPRHRIASGGTASVSEDGLETLEPVTNVSGIEPEEWDPQEMGRVVVHSIQFRRTRDAYLADVIVATNRLVIRLEKLFRMLKDTAPKTAKQMKSMEQNVVHWKKDKEEKMCGGCGGNFGVIRRRHHCRLCGDIRCKECCHFMTLLETYPLLSDCPDYPSLVPPETLPKKRFKFKRQASSPDEEEEASNEVRMCAGCKKLVDRRLIHQGAVEKNPIMALYDKMKHFMTESERLKPGFLEVSNVIWSGEPGPSLQDATRQRQELLRVYESVDAASKRILSMGASDPSPRGQKLARSVRAFASNYLQQHLLTLPSLPTPQQLIEISERKEREAQEKMREIERQREEQRRLKAIREAKSAAATATASEDSALEKISSEFGKMSADIDKINASTLSGHVDKCLSDVERLFSRETIKDISRGFQRVFPGNKTDLEAELKKGDMVEEGGWMCDTDQVMRSIEGQEEQDPFILQREQLLSYIAQARAAKRYDEVKALEQSLSDIERAMKERHMSYGFT